METAKKELESLGFIPSRGSLDMHYYINDEIRLHWWQESGSMFLEDLSTNQCVVLGDYNRQSLKMLIYILSKNQ